MIAIGANFTQAMIQRGMNGYNIDEETIDMSNVKLYLDMTCKSPLEQLIEYINNELKIDFKVNSLPIKFVKQFTNRIKRLRNNY